MRDEDREQMKHLFAIPDREWDSIRPLLRHESYAKGDFAVREGALFRSVGYVLRGLLRSYHLDDAGVERTKAFRSEGGMISPYAEILRGEPSRSNIQAIESSEVIWLPFDAINEMSKESLFWMGLLRAQAEKNFLLKEQREYEFLNLSAEAQYERFITEDSARLARIPQFLIASYLGITPVALSRIKSRLASKSK